MNVIVEVKRENVLKINDLRGDRINKIPVRRLIVSYLKSNPAAIRIRTTDPNDLAPMRDAKVAR